MTSDRVAVLGTGLIGTSIAMAAARAGHEVSGWDADPAVAARAAARAGLSVATSLQASVEGASIVVVCAPIAEIPRVVVETLRTAPEAIVTDVGSIKKQVMRSVRSAAGPGDLPRFVGGHPMGGSERSGPEHASPSIVDGIVWALTPGPTTDAGAVGAMESFVRGLGALPMRMDAERHDRLVAFVSHLPQIASTTLMGLAATEEASEPEILLLAAGGFRDLTRLAASNPALWSEILVANSDAIGEAIDLYVERLLALRGLVAGARSAELEEAFEAAKSARLQLVAKPRVRSGVAVFQVEVPDRPGALAQLTGAMAEGKVNIEDLQIVHSPEGGRGTVHLMVAAPDAEETVTVLEGRGFDPIRLA